LVSPAMCTPPFAVVHKREALGLGGCGLSCLTAAATAAAISLKL
jgi:hypothetical protein